MAAPGLSLEGIVAGYGDGTVLHEIGLALAAGERVGLVGRNGAGKTTLMRAVMGLLPIRSGSAWYRGKRLDRLQTFEIARLGIAYVPQGREIFGGFSVRQNLMLGVLGIRGIAGAAADRPEASMPAALDLAFQAFPWLAERAQTPAGNLSGGQQQQLAIARALVSRPGLLMLDEPLEGIQPSVVDQIVAALDSVCAQYRTGLLIAEQNVDAVLALCQRVILIDSGKAVGDHPAAQLRLDRSPIDRVLGL